jgi:hypothetical protein
VYADIYTQAKTAAKCIHAFEAKHGVNITTRNVGLRVGSRDACTDVLSMLDDLWLSRADFVVLKFGTH